jgi:hypothetical protein
MEEGAVSSKTHNVKKSLQHRLSCSRLSDAEKNLIRFLSAMIWKGKLSFSEDQQPRNLIYQLEGFVT